MSTESQFGVLTNPTTSYLNQPIWMEIAGVGNFFGSSQWIVSMAENLFRITVDEPNYSKVLKEPVEIEKVRNVPGPLQAMQTARVWAINPGSRNENVYQQLQSGDHLLFYLGGKHRPSGDGIYDAVGTVGKKFKGDEDAARELFGNIHAVRMFTVEDFELISKTKNDIERILGYTGDPEGSHKVHEKHYSSLERVMDKLRA